MKDLESLKTLILENETAGYILLVVITLIVATILVLVLRKLIGVFIQNYAKKLKTDPTNFSFIKNSVGFVIYTSAIIFIFFLDYIPIFFKGIHDDGDG